jgi:hypothetical protein
MTVGPRRRLRPAKTRRLCRKGHVAAHVEMWPKRVGLEDKARPAPLSRHMKAWPADQTSTQTDLASIRCLQPGNQPK